MAVQTPPYVLQNSSHGSELVRREALASLTYGTAGGVVPATPTTSANLTAGVAGCSDLKVNAPVSGMSCLINPGQCYVPGTLGSGSGYGIGTGYGMPTVTLNGGAAPTVATGAKAATVQLTTQGIYYCYNDNSGGQVSATVAASNASNPRIDVVVAQVEDAAYSGANNDWKLAVVTGTAAASPAVPSVPANSLVLAYLWIPAASTNVTAGNILDLRIASNRNPFVTSVHATSASTLTNTTYSVVTFNVVDLDLVGAWNTGTNTWTAPVTGRYHVVSRVALSATCTNFVIAIFQNGAQTRNGQVDYKASAIANSSSVESVLSCAAGDTIKIEAYQNTGGAANNSATALDTYLDISLLSVI